jgi:hypothetical protein
MSGDAGDFALGKLDRAGASDLLYHRYGAIGSGLPAWIVGRAGDGRQIPRFARNDILVREFCW